MKQYNQRGFTLVELAVVISVIAILSVVTVVSYGAWRNGIDRSTLRSDLTASASQLENDRNFQNVFPITMEAANGGRGLPRSPGTSYRYTSTGATYCLTAYSTNLRIQPMNIRSQSGAAASSVVVEGACSGHSRP